jgi:hypothetical protein
MCVAKFYHFKLTATGMHRSLAKQDEFHEAII